MEKEVVLYDAAPLTASAAPHDQMQVDPVSLPDLNAVTVDTPPAENPSESESRVLKVIKKLEVQILCTQHNPVSRIVYLLV